jgi:hypothetical protein
MTTKAEYIIALLRELERIHPAPKWTSRSHAITWRGTVNPLLLLNRGDALQIHEMNPADLSDDPAGTAQRLVARLKDMRDDDPAHFIFFKH